jgi:hypothetical protein
MTASIALRGEAGVLTADSDFAAMSEVVSLGIDSASTV